MISIIIASIDVAREVGVSLNITEVVSPFTWMFYQELSQRIGFCRDAFSESENQGSYYLNNSYNKLCSDIDTSLDEILSY